MPSTDASLLGIIGASFMTTSFDLCPVSHAYSSFDDPVSASLSTADFSIFGTFFLMTIIPPMVPADFSVDRLDIASLVTAHGANSFLLSKFGASVMTARVTLRPMLHTDPSLLGMIEASTMAADCLLCPMAAGTFINCRFSTSWFFFCLSRGQSICR